MITLCKKCKRDISQYMKYWSKGEPYCYTCFEEIKGQRQKKSPLIRQIKAMYKEGYKPTEIAKLKGISTSKVYDALNGKNI